MTLIDANWRYLVSQKGSMSLHLRVGNAHSMLETLLCRLWCWGLFCVHELPKHFLQTLLLLLFGQRWRWSATRRSDVAPSHTSTGEGRPRGSRAGVPGFAASPMSSSSCGSRTGVPEFDASSCSPSLLHPLPLQPPLPPAQLNLRLPHQHPQLLLQPRQVLEFAGAVWEWNHEQPPTPSGQE